MYIYYDQRASDKKTIIVTLIIDLIEDNHLILQFQQLKQQIQGLENKIKELNRGNWKYITIYKVGPRPDSKVV